MRWIVAVIGIITFVNLGLVTWQVWPEGSHSRSTEPKDYIDYRTNPAFEERREKNRISQLEEQLDRHSYDLDSLRQWKQERDLDRILGR